MVIDLPERELYDAISTYEKLEYKLRIATALLAESEAMKSQAIKA